MPGGKRRRSTRAHKGEQPFTIAEVIRRALEQRAPVTFVFNTGRGYPLEECLSEVKQK